MDYFWRSQSGNHEKSVEIHHLHKQANLLLILTSLEHLFSPPLTRLSSVLSFHTYALHHEGSCQTLTHDPVPASSDLATMACPWPRMARSRSRRP
ncbi:hypothetical protein BT93_C1643 [Corymbia citriodora subsp. variegata]|nr:hypothetical protein BT93_C1643 [Corymbia citriodora subsp. variegata]